jgi:hypothetical protein
MIIWDPDLPLLETYNRLNHIGRERNGPLGPFVYIRSEGVTCSILLEVPRG